MQNIAVHDCNDPPGELSPAKAGCAPCPSGGLPRSLPYSKTSWQYLWKLFQAAEAAACPLLVPSAAGTVSSGEDGRRAGATKQLVRVQEGSSAAAGAQTVFCLPPPDPPAGATAAYRTTHHWMHVAGFRSMPDGDMNKLVAWDRQMGLLSLVMWGGTGATPAARRAWGGHPSSCACGPASMPPRRAAGHACTHRQP